MSAAIDYTYNYPFASSVVSSDSGLGVSLATCDAKLEHPHFFSGTVLQPRQFAQMLLVLSEVVRTHFFLQRPALLDPVVTSHPEILRLEGFSGCCGVYARIDLPQASFDGEILGSGTTNVDFNDPMRTALNRIRDNDHVEFNVGREQVELGTSEGSVVEKKVKLPVRWIKGFSEVQAYQPGLQPRLQVTASEAKKFLRSLPKGAAPKKISYAVPMGKSVRLSQRESKGAVAFQGIHRVRVLEPLLNGAQSLRIWSDEATGTSGWEVIFATGRFFLMLSPEVYRGFSGEGQVLESLSKTNWQSTIDEVQELLAHEKQIDLERATDQLNRPRDDVSAALSVLGSRGLAGFDVTTETIFYRQLPFDLTIIEKLQPRLKGARKLIETGGIKISNVLDNGDFDVTVPGTGVDHYIRLRESGDLCSCPWFSKYEGQRGPCKHVLAARMFVENQVDQDGENG